MLDKKHFLTANQVKKRIKLEPHNPDYVQLSVDVRNFWDYYLTYYKHEKKVHKKVDFTIPNTAYLIERLIADGHIEADYRGGQTDFIQMQGKDIEVIPQRYVSNKDEVISNKRAHRMFTMGWAISEGPY